ncbi:MAG: branched-chain amino acid ABC transporter permease [Chloroflexi bacterium]|nr:branched-chain amino acid ABC transporter permease [Chloroflexota bacterium]MDA8189678.1 branched-chain amino acid ABC transporter permease [Dehalococcoidales bacterium]
MYQVTQSLVSGILTGGIFALLGVGFSLTWGVTRAINVAHAAFAVIAAYVAYWLLQMFHVDPLLALVLIVPLMFSLGVAFHRTLIKPTGERTHDLELASMMLTFGLAAAIENGIAYVWSPDPRVINTVYTGKALSIAGISMPIAHILGFGLALATIAALYFYLERTFTGKAVRAVWQNRVGAALCGIDLERVTSITYGLALASAGVAGVAMALIYTFDPATQFSWLIYAFLVVIFGGVGSVLGSLLAGLFIGIVLGLSGLLIPFAWSNLLLFAMLIAFLFWRPTGLLRR